MTGRLIGLALLVTGLTLGWVFAPVPNQSPDTSELAISFAIGGAIVAPICMVIGLLLLVGGDRLYNVINGPAKTPRQKTTMIILYGVAAAAGLCGLVWYNSINPIF